jgi:hypothetical protein
VMCACYALLIMFEVMTLDGRIFYFTSAATVGQLLELLITEIEVRNG